jgi:PE family
MSDVTAVPEAIAAAATDVAAVGSTVNAAHMAAAAPTVAVIPAAADEVSAGIANLFSGFAKEYQTLAGQASAFQQQFVQHLHASAASYSSAEAVNAGSLGSAAALSLSSIADIPNQLVSQVNGIFAFASSAFQLSVGIVYELLVFGYTTLAILIGLEDLALKFAGVTIPIP